MKKIIALTLSLMICAGCILSFSSCTREDPAEYLSTLEDRGGYMAMNVSDYKDYYFNHENYVIKLSDIVDGLIEDIYCKYNNRIYFCYSEENYETGEAIWNIASVGEDGYSFELHGSYALDRSKNYSYTQLDPGDVDFIGGYYVDGEICLSGTEENLVYDIVTDTVRTEIRLPVGRYDYNFSDHSQDCDIVITDTYNGEVRNVYYDELEDECPELQELVDIVGYSSLSDIIANGGTNYGSFAVINGELIYFFTYIDTDAEYGKSNIAIFKYNFDRNYLIFQTHIEAQMDSPRPISVHSTYTGGLV